MQSLRDLLTTARARLEESAVAAVNSRRPFARFCREQSELLGALSPEARGMLEKQLRSLWPDGDFSEADDQDEEEAEDDEADLDRAAYRAANDLDAHVRRVDDELRIRGRTVDE